jgi:hypothetical protein
MIKSEKWRLGSLVCAELLIPHSVDCKLIRGAYVLDAVAQARFNALKPNVECVINRDIFLR